MIEKGFLVLIIVFYSIAQPSTAQNMALEMVKEKMGIYHVNFPQEKVYIHHDKPQYVLGEQIWFKAYLLSAILHDPITPSQQVIVELIDPSNVLLSSATIPIVNGGGSGDFFIGPNWETGTYLIRAYTNYQRNFEEQFFFQKEIRVYNAYSSMFDDNSGDIQTLSQEVSGVESSKSGNELKLTFFPEGGDLVAGVATKVAINAFDGQFAGKEIQGTIVDSGGIIVSRFSTHMTGLGMFKLIPKPKEKYIASLLHNNEELSFNLPSVKEEGYSLAIVENRDTLTITTTSTTQTGLTGSFVVGHVRGQLVGLVEGLSGSKSIFKMPLTGAPDGVLHFTLFSAEGIPVSERLVFLLREENQHKIELSITEQEYGMREQVSVNIQKSQKGGDLSLNGSMTVTELALASPNKYSSDIRTYLLMESDLRGRIPDPGYFFGESNSNKALLDLLMLTHGWRRFEWDSLLNDPIIDVNWFPENTLSLKGYTTKYGNVNKRVKSRVFFATLTDDFSMQEQLTDENGYFEFTGVDGYDTIPLLIQAEIYKETVKESKKKKKGEGPIGNRYVDIFIEDGDRPDIDRRNSLIDIEQDPKALQDYFLAARKTSIVDSAYKNILTYQLDEIVVQAEKIDPVEGDRIILYGEPDRRLVADSLKFGYSARSVFELIRGQFPGVTVVGSYPNYNIIMRGANSIQGSTYAVYLLDGAEVDVGLINVLPVERIAFVDVLSSLSKTTIYGTRGNGIVAIYTKTGNEMTAREVVGTLNYTFPGYHKPKVFYSPDYGRDPNSIKPDFRTTLYWDPEINVTSNKPRKLSFYTSDKATVYSLRFEGITSDGTPVVFRKNFEVNERK